ncbi:DNA adenine methylase [Candidatus Methanomassiliicoccus intestinalis]|uniref:D12 class N6 adenine-specific DNA methyltransferase n=2 Tax=Candidatus Methanomassiliicoccus intestinalis TaxID=1406512 RepID=R9T6M0_METII|nr:DNA adenine methylase [Candidatus Methanomassiliicoccus intestinalis]AGN26370.1 D12 class N6 adenine-specific DNA methyltransferase [Candidatus Methanomassiliicoccus intestinalis Issoire-Mx1]
MTLPPFPYYGAKTKHLRFLLPLLPQTKCYCEPFGGSMAVMLARTPSEVETYNDIDSNVVNFFRVLREQPDKLLRMLELTPFSREEYNLARDMEKESDLERARMFFLRASVSYGARYSRGAFNTTNNNSVNGVPERISRYRRYLGRLEAVSERILRIQIENLDALDIIKRYDTPDTLFYCDPPYDHSARVQDRCYKVEPDSTYHRLIASALRSIEGYAAISGYKSRLYEELYSGWYCTEDKPNRYNENHSERTEVLWTNYNPETFEKISIMPQVKQLNLDGIEGGACQ